MNIFENQIMQWKGNQGTPSPPSSFGSGPQFCCEALHWPVTERRQTQNSPKGCSQVSWEARPSSPTTPRGFFLSQSCVLFLACECSDISSTSLHNIRFVSQVLRHLLPHSCPENGQLLPQGPLNSALFDVFMAHNLFYALSGAKPVDYHSSCSSLLVYLCCKESVCFCFRFYKELRWFERKNQ